MPKPFDPEKAKAAIAQRVEIAATGCWLWKLSLDLGGYGVASLSGSTRRAHRLSYEAHVGQIPEGMVIDHLCRVRHCVNPAHLEPVTTGENIRRGETGSKPKDVCKRGHLFSEHGALNSSGHKRCKACASYRRETRRQLNPPRSRGRKGADHHGARISEADVIAIRLAEPVRGYCRDLAARFGVTRCYITDIRIGKTWRHVEPRNYREAAHAH